MFDKTIMLTLLAMLAVCNALYISHDVSYNASFYADDDKGEDREKKIEKISDGIDKANSALKETKKLITSDKCPNFKAVFSLIEEYSKLGELVFPELKVFSTSMALLNGLIDGGDSGDDKITKGIVGYKNVIIDSIDNHIRYHRENGKFYYNPYIKNLTIDDSLHPFLQSSVLCYIYMLQRKYTS